MTDPRWLQPAPGVWTRTIGGEFYELIHRPDCYVVRHYGENVAHPPSLASAKRAALKHAKGAAV